VLIIEASANTFTIAERSPPSTGRSSSSESHRAGQIGKSYLANDKLDAAKIARIYLSGLSIKVWQPDSETRQRRELALDLPALCQRQHTRAATSAQLLERACACG
jgi:hypothetical protein